MSISLMTAQTPRYDQDPQNVGNNRCGSYAFTGALRVLAERFTGQILELSEDFLYYIAQADMGLIPGDYGANPGNYANALKSKGICTRSDYQDYGNPSMVPPSSAFTAAKLRAPIEAAPMPYVNNSVVDSLEHQLQMGNPVAISIKGTQSYRTVSGPWTTHTWDSSGIGEFEHMCLVVGLDRPNGRVQVLDSSVNHYGDNGLVGYTFDKFEHGPQRCVNQLWVITKSPWPAVKVGGYMPGIPDLSPTESDEFVDDVSGALYDHLFSVLLASGLQAFVDECVKWKVSDKHLEKILLWQRGTVIPTLQSQGADYSKMKIVPL